MIVNGEFFFPPLSYTRHPPNCMKRQFCPRHLHCWNLRYTVILKKNSDDTNNLCAIPKFSPKQVRFLVDLINFLVFCTGYFIISGIVYRKLRNIRYFCSKVSKSAVFSFDANIGNYGNSGTLKIPKILKFSVFSIFSKINAKFLMIFIFPCSED